MYATHSGAVSALESRKTKVFNGTNNIKTAFSLVDLNEDPFALRESRAFRQVVRQYLIFGPFDVNFAQRNRASIAVGFDDVIQLPTLNRSLYCPRRGGRA